MIQDLILLKAKGNKLSQENYYEVVDYMIKHGADKLIAKFFIALDSFGMSKEEVYRLALAMRDSGRVLKFNMPLFEKHSTGGVGDPTSIVLIPLIASLGYKIIKMTARSLVFTNGSADRFKAIPHFKVMLTNEEIEHNLNTTNACVISHGGDMCPADRVLFDIMEKYGLEHNLNLLAASIACKKFASGAKIVLVDVKYGDASVIKRYLDALSMAKILKYVFKKNGIKPILTISSTVQTFGDGIGNAIELVDALNVLQGRKCLLRDVSVRFAVEMITTANPTLDRSDAYDMINSNIDNGLAYKKFMEIVSAQGGDTKILQEAKVFKPYRSVNFVADRDGYVGSINSLVLGEIVRRICETSHDDNIGIALRVKIGDFIKKGEILLSFYYKDESDFDNYITAISGCIRITNEKIKEIYPIRKVIR